MDDTRSRILNAAGPVFAEKGFEAATIREICHEGGVNLAAVNYHFGSKERLYIEAIKQAHERRVASVPLTLWPEGTPAAERLAGFIRTLLGRMLGDQDGPWFARLMMREILNPTDACRELVEDFIRPEFEMVLGILGELLPPEVPMHRRRQMVFSIVGQCLYYRVAWPVVSLLVPVDELAERFDVEHLARHITQVVLAACGAAAPVGQDSDDADGVVADGSLLAPGNPSSR